MTGFTPGCFLAYLIAGAIEITGDKDIERTIEYINKHNIQGIKFHSVYVIEDTKLAQMYRNGDYTPIDLDYYIKEVCYCLTHINPEIVVHKISGDAPKNLLIAPEWNLHKKWIINGVEKYLKNNDSV